MQKQLCDMKRVEFYHTLPTKIEDSNEKCWCFSVLPTLSIDFLGQITIHWLFFGININCE